jgi:uncharacterized membrane protein
MQTENTVLMDKAKESLRGNWGLAIGTMIVFFILVGSLQVPTVFFPPSGLLILLITGPMNLGLIIFFLSLARNEGAQLEQMFFGFKRFGTALGTYLLMVILTFLWTLLLVVPGIIAAFSYSLTFYILADNENISPMDAIDKSKAMMYGFKAKLFRLYLRFFGWALLCILTLGIGFLWLVPWAQVTMAKFYDDVKSDYQIRMNPSTQGIAEAGI